MEGTLGGHAVRHDQGTWGFVQLSLEHPVCWQFHSLFGNLFQYLTTLMEKILFKALGFLPEIFLPNNRISHVSTCVLPHPISMHLWEELSSISVSFDWVAEKSNSIHPEPSFLQAPNSLDLSWMIVPSQGPCLAPSVPLDASYWASWICLCAGWLSDPFPFSLYSNYCFTPTVSGVKKLTSQVRKSYFDHTICSEQYFSIA